MQARGGLRARKKRRSFALIADWTTAANDGVENCSPKFNGRWGSLSANFDPALQHGGQAGNVGPWRTTVRLVRDSVEMLVLLAML